MNITALIRALVQSGATPEMILAAVESQENDMAHKREEARQRKIRQREREKYLQNNDSVTVTERDGSVTSCDIPTPSSSLSLLSPIPPNNTLSPSTPTPECTNAPARGVRPKQTYPPAFGEFWRIYPRHDGSKFKAAEIFTRFTKEGIAHEIVIDGARKYAEYVSRNAVPADKIAHATTWLNGRRWEAEYVTGAAARQPQPASKTSDSLAALRDAGNRPRSGRGVEPDAFRGDDLDLRFPPTANAGGT
jgi:hypothetical protein